MVEGTIDAIADQKGDRPPGILIGADLAQELTLHVGDS